MCPDCQEVMRSRGRAYYHEKGNASHNRRRQARVDWKAAYLARHPCVDCGNPDIRVLEFDHVRGEKVMGVGSMVSQCRPIDMMEIEAKKCEIRCSNCHKIRHAEERATEM